MSFRAGKDHSSFRRRGTGVWDPSMLPGNVGYFDARSGVTVTGGFVTAWAPIAAAFGPAHAVGVSDSTLDAINGVAAVRLTGVASGDGCLAVDENIVSTQPFTWWGVMQADGGGAAGRLFDTSAFGGSRSLPSPTPFQWGTYSGGALETGIGVDANPHLYVGVGDGANAEVYLDGALLASGNAGLNTLGSLQIGGASGINYPGRIAALGFAETHVTTGDLTNLSTFAAAWGL